MAFGVGKEELTRWKAEVRAGRIAFLTHFWVDERFPGCDTVTKVGCADVDKLKAWGRNYGLKPEWIDYNENFPHFDLFGKYQYEILKAEGKDSHIRRFRLHEKESRYF
ncbi:hypothetical protein [Salimicrobium halophilum]|uniref:Uncharacterized protein n=1 Tax=Salimicrobium halophilum TaxID=86666 RepID=A0A1G8Q508_9BACI|nr:hypothetical protein [Salimicrobium halophilum]SDI99842.1 hypothetical protein SAMN04490247_0401 [Salimicrobium halophilum]